MTFYVSFILSCLIKFSLHQIGDAQIKLGEKILQQVKSRMKFNVFQPIEHQENLVFIDQWATKFAVSYFIHHGDGHTILS